LGASFVLTSASRARPHAEWIGRLSPLHYFELNKPLVTGYATSVSGLLIMAALALVLTALGLLLVTRRDIGAATRFESPPAAMRGRLPKRRCCWSAARCGPLTASGNSASTSPNERPARRRSPAPSHIAANDEMNSLYANEEDRCLTSFHAVMSWRWRVRPAPWP
jgi:hypothetical protein